MHCDWSGATMNMCRRLRVGAAKEQLKLTTGPEAKYLCTLIYQEPPVRAHAFLDRHGVYSSNLKVFPTQRIDTTYYTQGPRSSYLLMQVFLQKTSCIADHCTIWEPMHGNTIICFKFASWMVKRRASGLNSFSHWN